MGAGFAVGLADLFVVTQGPLASEGGYTLTGAVYALGLATLTGALVGGLVASALALARWLARGGFSWWSTPEWLTLALVAACLLLLQNVNVFDGGRMRQHPRRPLFVGLFIVGVPLLAVISAWVLGRLWIRAKADTRRAFYLSALFGLMGAGLFLLDATCLIGLYPMQHLQLAEGSLFCWAITLLLLQERHPKAPTRWMIPALSVGLIAALPWVRSRPEFPIIRAAIARETVSLKQWMGVPEFLLDRFQRVREGETADVAGILRERDRERHSALDLELDALLADRRKLNLVVLSIDTLRADRTGFLGLHPTCTPRLDELAETSIVASECRTQYPTSSWSYSSFFSGRYPSASPAANALAGIPKTEPPDLTLAGALAARGLETVAITAFNWGTLQDRAVFGHLVDGFRVVNPSRAPIARDAPDVTAEALRELDRIRSQQFFLWVHYLDPHAPYKDPPGRTGQSVEVRYQGEISRADEGCGRLLDHLRRRNLWDKTIVVLMSDHGEEFGEHGSRYHNTSLYEEQVRVPLLIRVPGLAAKRIDGPVGLVDVLPTLFDLLGISDPYSRHGRSLLPLVFGASNSSGFTFAELFADPRLRTGGREMVVFRGKKLVRDPNSGTEEVFDLSADPGEQKNVLLESPSAAAQLRGLLRARNSEIDAMRLPEGQRASRDTLRSRMARLVALPEEDRDREFLAFFVDVTDPVNGLSSEHGASLRGPLLEEFKDLIARFATSGPSHRRVLALQLANHLEDRSLLWIAEKALTPHPEVILECVILRAVLGDPTVVPQLRAALERDGAPDKDRLAMALLLLGERCALDHALSVCRLEKPRVVARILAGLGRVRAPELIPLAEEMLAHTHWDFPPLKRALAKALARAQPSVERDRFLGRLAADVDPKTVALARQALEASYRGDDLKRRLGAGLSEFEGDVALVHMDLETAATRLDTAASRLPAVSLGLTLKRARVRRRLNQEGWANALLLQAASRHPDDVARATLQASARVVPDLRPPSSGKVAFKLVGELMDDSSLPGKWSFARIELQNADATYCWSGGRLDPCVFVRPTLVNPEGKALPPNPAFDCYLERDVAPGERITLDMPFVLETNHGEYRLAFTLWFRSPEGEFPISDTTVLHSSIEVGRTRSRTSNEQ